MKSRATRGGVILEIVLIVASIGLLGKAVLTGASTYKFTHLVTLGTVDATIRNIEDHGFTLDIEFLLPTNEMVAIQQNIFVPKYKVGQHVPVLYDTAQPGAARMNSLSALWFHPIIYGIPGFILLVWGLRLFFGPQSLMAAASDPPLFYQAHVFCCTNKRAPGHERGCCADKGAERLRNYMKKRARELGLEGVRINTAGCLDRCELGPCVVVYPEGVWYAPKNEADVDEILTFHLHNHGRVERLMLAPDQKPAA